MDFYDPAHVKYGSQNRLIKRNLCEKTSEVEFKKIAVYRKPNIKRDYRLRTTKLKATHERDYDHSLKLSSSTISIKIFVFSIGFGFARISCFLENSKFRMEAIKSIGKG